MLRFFLLLFLFIFSSSSAFALDMMNFKTIPVLHDGRLKPLDSFARAELRNLYGKDQLKSRPAIDWLAETIFTPGTTIDTPVFKIESGNLRHSLGLEEKDDFTYSFTEIVPGLKKTSSAVTALLKKEPKDLSRDDKNLLKIHDQALGFTSLMRSLSLLLPLDVKLPEKYKQTKDISYLDLRKLEQDLNQDVKNITSIKGENIGKYSEDEKRTALLAFQLNLMSSAAANNNVLKIIPPQWTSDDGNWHAPWELLQKGEGSPQTAQILETWRALGKAYAEKNNQEWQTASQSALSSSTNNELLLKLKLENIQNTIQPFKLSTFLYALSFITVILAFVFTNRFNYMTSATLLTFGGIVHLTGLILRVYLLARPPVGTLYESIIFVSLVTVVISLIVERKMKNGTGLLIGSISGLGLGLMSFSFAGEGDTMEMLTAVLNTNFWLATHVLCITMGYGWCILTAVFAHLYLASNKLRDDKSDFILHTLAILALLFTSIGTILGGIWADQSWGRFWGWDPKENGALLIVLWLIWLLHGKLGKQINNMQFFTGLAFTNVIVALSWIGVNLLGVGMHSYGFADGLFYGLGLFILTEIILISYLYKRSIQHA